MSEPMAEAPRVTEQSLDLTALAGADDRNLRVEVVWRSDDEEAQVVQRDVRDFPIAGSIPIPLMTRLLKLEAEINESLVEDTDESDRALEQALERAHQAVVRLIVDRTPDAFHRTEPINGKRVRGGIELSVGQILGTLAWIAGAPSVADAIAKALSSGASGAKSEDELAIDAAAKGLDEAEEAADPLGSTSSSAPSS